MVKTFANIWLDIDQPPKHTLSLVSSHTTLLSVHDLYDDDDLKAVDKTDVFIGYDTYQSVSSISDSDSETTLYKKPASQTLRDSKLFKSACLSIIRDSITRLSVLASIYTPHARQMKSESLLYRSLDERFGLHIEANYGECILNGSYTNWNKLQKDVKSVIKLFEELCDDINIFSIATCLDTYAETYYKMKEEEAQIMVEYYQKKEQFEHLQNMLTGDKQNILKQFEEMDNDIVEMNMTLKNLMEYNNTAVTVAKNWEISRQEQNSIVLERRKKEHVNEVLDTDEKIQLEDICHEDIQRYYLLTKDDCMDEIQAWMDRYDREIEEKEMLAIKIQHDTEAIIDEKEKLQNLYDNREKEMEEWLEHKRLKKQEEEQEALEEWAATKIQAWWREVMVRKKLGPYRKKKKGQKANNKNKKRNSES